MAEELNLQLATTQFSTNLRMRLQQQASLLRGSVSEGFHVGKLASPVDYIAPVSMKARGAMGALLDVTNNNYTRRWVAPQDKELTQRIDQMDKLRTVEDPQSAIVSSAAAAVARQWDDLIIQAFFSTALTGVDLSANSGALTNESFNVSSYGIADTFGNGTTTVGLTVDKLIQVRQIFRHNHALDDNPRIRLVIGSQQEADLYRQVEVVSTEFGGRPVFDGQGHLTSFGPFDITVSERLNYGTDLTGSGNSNCRQCAAYVPSGMYLGVWMDMQSNITKETLVSGQPWQIYTAMSASATRLEPGRLLLISCGNDTQGADPSNALQS